MWPLILAAAVAHVPQYDCEHGCCHAQHHHGTSQVAYVKNSGGVEIDVDDLNIEGEGEIVDFDFVFKEEYDMSTYSLHVGCGGCASRWPDHYDTVLTRPLALPENYEDPKLEAFTQTVYHAALPEGERRQFNTTALQNCSSRHFSLRLVKHDNATGDIVWGAVLGCPEFRCERFTTLERISFPIYVLRNHGSTWNNASWTFPMYVVLIGAFIALSLWWCWGGWLAFYVPRGPSFPRQIATTQDGTVAHWANLKCIAWEPSSRCVLYFFATWAILVDLFESLHHYCFYSGRQAAKDSTGHGIFAILVAMKLFFVLGAVLPWVWIREVPESKWRSFRLYCRFDDRYDGLGSSSPFWAHAGWWIFDVGIGLLAFFGYGSGFYVYPLAITLAGLLRAWHWRALPSNPAPPCDTFIAIDEAADTGCALAADLPPLNIG
jgi:hypothetical protein